ncbi:stage III sporulation protein AF [Bariatricus sp. SGI.154]|uniref:stage III sporulation protein AF n=1 Tax=Bariatricus sp. SGI.154 TaxID=3420549 RepID=UPI003CFD6B14
MFEYLYGWMQNIAFYMVMVTAVMHIIPNSDYKRYIRFFTGLVLVVMLTAPFLKILGMGDTWQGLYANARYQEQVQKMEEATKYLEEVKPYDYLEGVGKTSEGGQGNEMDSSEENAKIDVEEIRIGR